MVITMLLRALVLTLFSMAAVADDCPRGTLDKRFCDRNGDLLADTPEATEDQLQPRALIFAYTPVEDPAVYRGVWQEFLDHMQEVTGMRVVFFPVQSNAAQIEAMRSGRLHVAGFNTGSTPLAVNCAGFVPFAMMAAKDGAFGYEMEIITHKDSGVNAVEDIRGGTVAFSSPTSNSGFKAPSAILEAEFSLVGDRDYDYVFSGKHDNTILGVANRDYQVGAIANSVKERMISRGVINPDDLKVLFTSRTFPTTAFGYSNAVSPELGGKIREAFFSFNWAGTRLLEEFRKSGEEQFIPIEYNENWDVIRKIDRANGVSYACR